MHKRKRGRPRKAGARTPGGQLSRAAGAQPADTGTADAARHRLALVNGSAPELAGSPLTILQANDHLTREQVQAGERYARARAITFGAARPVVAHDLVEPHDPAPKDAEYLVRVRRRFEAMAAKLEPDQKRALDQVVVNQALPPWFRFAKAERPLRPIDDAERGHLLGALNALAGGEGVATS